MPTTPAPPCSASDRFQADGFLVARGLVPRDAVAAMIDAAMAQLAAPPLPGLRDQRQLPPNDPLARYPRLLHPHRHPGTPLGDLARRWLLDPRLFATVESLLGEPALAAQTMLYFKPPGARGQALHQDNIYLRVAPGTCMAAWVALDPADADNGGLAVVPGTHHEPIRCPEAADADASFTPDLVRPPAGREPVLVPLDPGDVLFFNGSLIHGSGPNRSRDRFRRAFICHYVPAASRAVSTWYAPLLTADGRIVERPAATGGGPCGDAGGPH